MTQTMAGIERPGPMRSAQASRLLWCSLLMVAYLMSSNVYADEQPKSSNTPIAPIAQWSFTKAQVGIPAKATVPFKPLMGQTIANAVGPIEFADDAPHALKLDGNAKAKHRIVVTDNADISTLPKQNLTLEAWVRIDKPVEWGGIVGCFQDNGSYERGWLLGYRNSQFCFALSSESQKRLTYLTASTTFESGFWYHVLGTYDGKTMTLFVDGKPVAKSSDQSGPIAYPEKSPFIIGAYEDENESHPMTGQLEQVGVWNRSLSMADVSDRFQHRKTLFPEIEPVRPNVVDWPTYNRDNQRTATSENDLPFPLHLKWVHHQRYAPEPAWPKPANQDFWHKKFNLKARVVYDRASHVVTVGDRLFFGSSADSSVHCLDTKTGQLAWKFTTEGPVRLAPTVVDDRVVFGSDDGHVYCVTANEGKLIWKRFAAPDGTAERRIPGNEQIISVWPVRTGILVEDNIGYFCAGLFPQQGVFQTAVDVRTGKKLASNKIAMSAQGYLERKTGRLFVATGRDPAGAFVASLKRRGKGVGREVASIPEEFRYSFIAAGDSKIGGGDGMIAAFNGATGEQTWNAKVEGKAWSLATARGRLYASTDTGAVYCFGPGEEPASVVDRRTKTAPKLATTTAAGKAAQIVELTDVHKGYALVSNCQSADLAIGLASETDLKIVATTEDHDQASQMRNAIDSTALANRISVHVQSATDTQPKSKLPYTDYIFNIVINDQVDKTTETKPTSEQLRVLRPLGGTYVGQLEESGVHTRDGLKGTGEWTHMYANAGNTVCSQDTLVDGPMDLQWFGRPGPQQMLDRHHRTIAPVWANGRLIIPGDNRVIAADAYNGTQLWNVAVPNSRRAGAYRDSSYLVANDDFVFVAAASSCLVLDAQTGKEKLQLSLPEQIDKKKREWGFLSADLGQVFGSTTKPGGIRRGHSLEAINEGTFWDFRPLVCSDSFFAADPKTGQNQWEYQPEKGMLVNSSFTIGPKHVYFVESMNEKTKDVANGRVDPRELMGQGSKVVALHRDSGSIAWTKDLDLTKVQHNVHCAFHDGKLVVVGSYNSGTDKKKDTVLYEVNVVHSDTGELAWKKVQKQGTKIGGDHGEQDHHPVIVGKKLYCEPYAYDLHNGKAIDFGWNPKHRRGCGTISASASTFFFRESNPTMFDLNSNSYSKVTTATRPGCWINMIPAGGLLLIPEASSGCTCNYAVQTSLAFIPRETSSGPQPPAPEQKP